MYSYTAVYLIGCTQSTSFIQHTPTLPCVTAVTHPSMFCASRPNGGELCRHTYRAQTSCMFARPCPCVHPIRYARRCWIGPDSSGIILIGPKPRNLNFLMVSPPADRTNAGAHAYSTYNPSPVAATKQPRRTCRRPPGSERLSLDSV